MNLLPLLQAISCRSKKSEQHWLPICHFFFFSSRLPAYIDVRVEKDYSISKSFLFFFWLLIFFLLLLVRRVSVIGQKNACVLVACQINLPVYEPKWIGEEKEESFTKLMVWSTWNAFTHIIFNSYCE
jgi:hypothetical protein